MLTLEARARGVEILGRLGGHVEGVRRGRVAGEGGEREGDALPLGLQTTLWSPLMAD
jgi:hypothetical protein